MDIAILFSRNLIEAMGMENMKSVIARNHFETNPGICHTHDFVDANMMMMNAIESLGSAFHLEDEQHTTRFNEAWRLAKENNFFLHQIQYDKWNHDVEAQTAVGQRKNLIERSFHSRVGSIVASFHQKKAQREHDDLHGVRNSVNHTILYEEMLARLSALVSAWAFPEKRDALVDEVMTEVCTLCGDVGHCPDVGNKQWCKTCLDDNSGAEWPHEVRVSDVDYGGEEGES